MMGSSYPMLIYLALVAFVIATPYAAALFMPVTHSKRWVDWAVVTFVLAAAIVLTIARQGGVLMLSAILLLPLVGRGPVQLIGGLAALLLFAPVVWWTPQAQLGPVAMPSFLLLALVAAYLLRMEALPPRGVVGVTPRILRPVIICGLIGLFAGLLTAPFGSAITIYIAWHHWGAYLAPVEAWLSGGLPYRDFPVQYGLGPTMLLATTCGQDCWRAIYGVAIAANALYFATLGGCALILTARQPRGLRWLAILALFCATFIWTGFPTSFAGPALTPSVAGLRFLPIAALLLYILIAEQWARPRDCVGHIIWMVGLFWSPEVGFFVTLVWWPYLAMRASENAVSLREMFMTIGGVALRGMAALAIGVVVLGTVVWMLSGRALTLSDFLVYIQHPPGVLPVNPAGTIWLALSVVVLVMGGIARDGLSPASRPLYACLLVFLAAASYFLSRSHDNNILNLFPLMVIVLLSLLNNMARSDVSQPGFVTGFAKIVLAAMIPFVATFNFAGWADAIAQNRLLDFGPTKLIAHFTSKHAQTPVIFPADAVAGLEYLRARDAGSVVVLNKGALMPWTRPGSGWTGVNNVANFEPLPDRLIVHYIGRGARVYHRPGWILVDDTRYKRWIAMFETAYDVQERRKFGKYSAIYLVPRKTP